MTTQIKAGVIAANAVNSSELASGALSGQNFTGDVTFDTTTLYVDSTNNRVGIKTTSPSNTLDVVGGFNLSGNLFVDTNVLATDVANNRVGIGTTSPDTLLHLSNNGTTPATIRIERNDTTISDTNIYGGIEFEGQDASAASAAGVRGKILGVAEGSTGEMALTFETAGSYGSSTERMRIDSSGRILIGTTSSSGSSVKLEAHDATNPIIQVKDTTSNIICGIQAGNSEAVIRCPQNSPLVFNVGASETERMRIDSSGNVGIAGTPPSDANTGYPLLSIGETTVIQGLNDLNESFFTNNAIWKSDNSWEYVKNVRAVQMAFADGTTIFRQAASGTAGNDITWSESMRINSSGSLLVNKSSATGSSLLQVAGFGPITDGVVAFYDIDTSAKANAVILKLDFSNDSTVLDGASFITFSDAGGARGSITKSGSGVAYNVTSDARLKDVTGSARGLEVINELNPVAYNWKSSGQADEGLIAQEVLDIVPNAVSGSEEEMYQMDYSKLVVHLVAGMKEQQTIIDDLKSRLDEAGL